MSNVLSHVDLGIVYSSGSTHALSGIALLQNCSGRHKCNTVAVFLLLCVQGLPPNAASDHPCPLLRVGTPSGYTCPRVHYCGWPGSTIAHLPNSNVYSMLSCCQYMNVSRMPTHAYMVMACSQRCCFQQQRVDCIWCWFHSPGSVPGMQASMWVIAIHIETAFRGSLEILLSCVKRCLLLLLLYPCATTFRVFDYYLPSATTGMMPGGMHWW